MSWLLSRTNQMLRTTNTLRGPDKKTTPQTTSINSPSLLPWHVFIPHGSLLTLFLESNQAPYQDHVTSWDVHVRRHWLFAPGGGAAAGRRASRGAIAELGWHAVEPWVAQGLRPLNTLWRPDRHSLATQLLGIRGDGGEALDHQKCIFFSPTLLARFHVFIFFSWT